jgi:hypothetical protein
VPVPFGKNLTGFVSNHLFGKNLAVLMMIEEG